MVGSAFDFAAYGEEEPALRRDDCGTGAAKTPVTICTSSVIADPPSVMRKNHHPFGRFAAILFRDFLSGRGLQEEKKEGVEPHPYAERGSA